MDGIIVVNKPENITSYDVIRKLKNVFMTTKIGHIGTLDPFATGVLVVAVNQGTKIIRYFVDDDKEYVATLKFGEMTDSYDLTGSVIKSKESADISKEALILTLENFVGEQFQLPPMYSAKKVGGVKLYEMARKGIEIKREEAKINIKNIELCEYNPPFATIKTTCSKGTYIRSLANDIGLKLGNYAHLTALKRTRSGEFDIAKARAISELIAAKERGTLADYMININDAIGFLPTVTVKERSEAKVKNGAPISDDDVKPPRDADIKGGAIRIVSEHGKLLAIANYERSGQDAVGVFKYDRVFLN